MLAIPYISRWTIMTISHYLSIMTTERPILLFLFSVLSIGMRFFTSITQPLNLFRRDLFGAAHRLRGRQKVLFPKIWHTYPALIKLSTVISYRNKFQKYMNLVTNSLSSANINIFSPETSRFFYIKKCRYRLHFVT